MASSFAVDTNLKKVLKVRYNSGKLPNLHLRRFPLLAMISKDNDFGGELLYVPIQTGDITGRSRTFSTSQSLNGSPKWSRWAIDVVPDYATNEIPRESVLRCRTGDAFIKLFGDATQNAIEACDRNMAFSLYRSKGGAKALIKAGSAVAATDLYLTNPADTAFFHQGQTVAAGTTEAMTTLRTGTAVITGIDRINGILRTSGSNWNTQITSLTNTDYIAISGDAEKSISGLTDWCPTTVASSGDSHFGVDRYGESYLYGYYAAITAGTPPEEHIKSVLNNAAMLNNGEFDSVFMNPLDFQTLEISLLNANMLRREVGVGEAAKWGFKGIVMTYSGGDVMVYSDPACPKGTFYGCKLSDLHLTFMGPKAGSAIIDDDAMFIRVSNADSYDLRVGNFAQLYTALPKNLCRGTI